MRITFISNTRKFFGLPSSEQYFVKKNQIRIPLSCLFLKINILYILYTYIHILYIYYIHLLSCREKFLEHTNIAVIQSLKKKNTDVIKMLKTHFCKEWIFFSNLLSAQSLSFCCCIFPSKVSQRHFYMEKPSNLEKGKLLAQLLRMALRTVWKTSSKSD